MKKIIQYLCCLVLAIAFYSTAFSQASICPEFGGGDEAYVMICDDYTYVVSTLQPSGGCSGAATGCSDSFPTP